MSSVLASKVEQRSIAQVSAGHVDAVTSHCCCICICRIKGETYLGTYLSLCPENGLSTLFMIICRFDFCMAPAQMRDSRMAAALLHFASRYAHGMPAALELALPDQVPTTAEELRHIEATHQVHIITVQLCMHCALTCQQCCV